MLDKATKKKQIAAAAATLILVQMRQHFVVAVLYKNHGERNISALVCGMNIPENPLSTWWKQISSLSVCMRDVRACDIREILID